MELASAGATCMREWSKLFAEYSQKYPDLAERLRRMQHRELPAGWDKNLPTFPADAKGIATRESSGKVLNVAGAEYSLADWRFGRSGDLEQDHAEV